MADRLLKRAVWLTKDQRLALLAAIEKAATHADADKDLCHEMLVELRRVHRKTARTSSAIQMMILWLRLPADVRPVNLCDVEIDQVILYGKADPTLKYLLRPGRRRRPTNPDTK
jgi:hypothetical protein